MTRMRMGVFVAIGLAVALLLALLVSPFASGQPDGLNKVAIDQGFADAEQPHATGDLPTAGYGLRGVENEGLGTGLAGVIGVVVTFGVGAGLFALVRRGRRTSSESP